MCKSSPSPLVLYTALYMPPAMRTQIYLTAEQRARLDELRRREGKTLAEVVRQAVDAYLRQTPLDPSDALGATFGAIPGIEAPRRDDWTRG